MTSVLVPGDFPQCECGQLAGVGAGAVAENIQQTGNGGQANLGEPKSSAASWHAGIRPGAVM